LISELRPNYIRIMDRELTQEERELLSLIAWLRGEAFVRRYEELILNQARAIGELDP
jgi:hypothetical protein